MEAEIENIKLENQAKIKNAIEGFADKTQYDYSNKVKNCLNFLYDQFGVMSLLDYNFDELMSLLKWIEAKSIIKMTKKRYRWYLRTVIVEILKPEIAQKKTDRLSFYNYVLSDECFEFSESGHKMKYPRIKPQEVKDLLDETLKTDIMDYMMFKILSFSGCRASGLLNIRIENIDFVKASFQTQEKKTNDSSGYNMYFLPKTMMDEIKVYCLRSGVVKGRLFNCNYQKLQYKIKKYRPELRLHLFRHAIRTNWKALGMDIMDAHFLLNHTPKNVDEDYCKSYYNEETLRAIYDKFFPY